MQVYQDLLADIMNNGDDAEYRNGLRRSVFGRQLRFNLKDSFPLVNTHQCFFRGMVEELIWLIGGKTNANELRVKGVNIWEKWAFRAERAEEIYNSVVAAFPETENALSVEGLRVIAEQGFGGGSQPFEGELGPIYGAQWRSSGGVQQWNAVLPKITIEDVFEDRLREIKEAYDQLDVETRPAFEAYVTAHYHSRKDQLNEMVMRLRHNPNHTGIIVSSWNPSQLPIDGIKPAANVAFGRMALAPCHTLFQAYVKSPRDPGGKRRLSLQLYQRSCDAPVGLPYNIAQYAALTHMLAAVCGMEVDELIWTGGNVHIYGDQFELVKEELKVKPSTNKAQLELRVPSNKDLTSFTAEDLVFVGYDPQSKIRYPVSE